MNPSPNMAGIRKPSRQLANSLDNPHIFLPLLGKPRAAIDLGPKLMQPPVYLQQITLNRPRNFSDHNQHSSLLQTDGVQTTGVKPQFGIGTAGNIGATMVMRKYGGFDRSEASFGHEPGVHQASDSVIFQRDGLRRNPSKSAGTLGIGAKRFPETYSHAHTTLTGKIKPYRSPFAAGAEHELRNGNHILGAHHNPLVSAETGKPQLSGAAVVYPQTRSTVPNTGARSTAKMTSSPLITVHGKSKQQASRLPMELVQDRVDPLDRQIAEIQRDLHELDGKYEMYANRIPRRTADY